MSVKVDLNRLSLHINYLYSELRETDQLLNILTQIINNDHDVNDSKYVILMQQYNTILKEQDNVRNRIVLLENTVLKFSDVEHTVSNDLDEAINALYRN